MIPRKAKRDASERRSYAGAGNPNYRDAARRVCSRCAVVFASYHKSRKYCSSTCYNLARSPLPAAAKEVRSAKVTPCLHCQGMSPARQKYCSVACYSAHARQQKLHTCAGCSGEFFAAQSSERKFCSYQCFVEDGGPVRAGLRSAEVIMKKYGAKKDANHKELMTVIGQFCAVHDLSHAGYGVPDGVAYVRGRWELFDIKNPKTSYGRRGLNQRQKKWVADWRGGPVYLIHSIDEAKRFASGQLADLKRQESGWDVPQSVAKCP